MYVARPHGATTQLWVTGQVQIRKWVEKKKNKKTKNNREIFYL